MYRVYSSRLEKLISKRRLRSVEDLIFKSEQLLSSMDGAFESYSQDISALNPTHLGMNIKNILKEIKMFQKEFEDLGAVVKDSPEDIENLPDKDKKILVTLTEKVYNILVALSHDVKKYLKD